MTSDVTGPLTGRTVVVTRAAEQAGELTRMLEALGADVVELPLIAVVGPADGGVALADALGRLDAVDWLVVTSPNGARRVAPALVDRPQGAPRVAAVGRATQDALGRRADLVPSEQIAEGLLAEFPHGPGTVLVAQAADARSTLVDGLRERGWTVEIAVTHRTAVAPADLLDDPAWQAARERAVTCDAVLFTSGSAVRGWAAAVGSRTPGIVVAIGPATADVARKESVKITHVSADHSLDGLMAVLVEAVAHRQ